MIYFKLIVRNYRLPPSEHSLLITPRRVCASGVKQLVLSVCRLSSEKICNLEIYRVKRLLISTITFKKIGACVPDRDQSGSIPRISSFFLFNIDIVRHFNTVNNLDTVEAGHMRTLDTCSCYHIRREASVSLIRQSVTPTAWILRYTSLCFTALALQSTTSWRNCTLWLRQLPEPAASTIPTAS